MKKHSFFFLVTSFTILTTYAQKVKTSDVPDVVKSALQTKYPGATHVYWEKEHGNYEANWGGKSHEDHSAQFTASGNFLEYVEAIPVTELPKEVEAYLKTHYKGAKITEAGKVTDAHGKLFYEAEVHKKDIMFDEHGKFVKEEG
jgi:hypothetical protein